MLDGNRTGNLFLRRELQCFASITLLYEAKQQQTRNKTFASLCWRNLLPPKMNPKERIHSPIHTTNWRHLWWHPARQPAPQTHPKNLRALTPIFEARTPVAKAIWGKNDKGHRSPQRNLSKRSKFGGFVTPNDSTNFSSVSVGRGPSFAQPPLVGVEIILLDQNPL